MELDDVTWPSGKNNTGGIQQAIYVGLMADVLTFPSTVATDPLAISGDLKDLVTINADLVMKDGKPLKKVYVTLEKGELKHDGQGEMDGRSFANTLDILHPGNSPEALGFLSFVKNADLVILLADTDGQKRLLGNRGYPAKLVDSKGTTGGTTASLKHSTMQFKSAGNIPAPIFNGAVIVDEAEQDIVFL